LRKTERDLVWFNEAELTRSDDGDG